MPWKNTLRLGDIKINLKHNLKDNKLYQCLALVEVVGSACCGWSLSQRSGSSPEKTDEVFPLRLDILIVTTGFRNDMLSLC